MTFGVENWTGVPCGYPMATKIVQYRKFTRFDRIHERDGQTNTAKAALAYSIARQKCHCA